MNLGLNPSFLLQIKSVCEVVGRDFMLVFDERCIRSDLWNKMHEKWEKMHILANFCDMYRYTLNMYRYSLLSGQIWPTCTGTGQRCTGTCTVLFSCSDQFS